MVPSLKEGSETDISFCLKRYNIVSTDGLDRGWVLRDLYFIKRSEMSPDFHIRRILLAFYKKGEYNTVTAVNSSVLVRKPPLEQNQTHIGMQ